MDDNVYRDEDFAHGLRCMDCNHLFIDGEQFSSRLEALTADGIPICELICVGCATRPVLSAQPV